LRAAFRWSECARLAIWWPSQVRFLRSTELDTTHDISFVPPARSVGWQSRRAPCGYRVSGEVIETEYACYGLIDDLTPCECDHDPPHAPHCGRLQMILDMLPNKHKHEMR